VAGHHQELLFEARPGAFSPMIVGAMRWSWVEIDALDADEIAHLVREAWAEVVPKRVSRAYAPPDGLTSVTPPGSQAPGRWSRIGG
jgi:hypothetical protein